MPHTWATVLNFFLVVFVYLFRSREVDVCNRWKIDGNSKTYLEFPSQKKVSNFLRCQLIMFCILCNLNNIYKSSLSKLITFYILILDIQYCSYYIYVVSHKWYSVSFFSWLSSLWCWMMVHLTATAKCFCFCCVGN